MTEPFRDPDSILSGIGLSPEQIVLTLDHLEQALQLSQTMPPAQQWPLYIQTLAWLGMGQWLQKRLPDLVPAEPHIDRSMPPSDAVAGMSVGGMTLMVLATELLYEPVIPLPDAVLASGRPSPDVYVWVEVLEEAEAVTIEGFLNAVQGREAIAARAIDAETDGLPVEWFDRDIDRLLLYLRAAARPAVAPAVVPFPIPPIQVRRWFTDPLDSVAQALSWVLLPPLSLQLGFRPVRSPIDEFQEVIAALGQHPGIAVPLEARAAYQDFLGEGLALRLYVATWPLPLTATPHEWALLLVLSGQPGTTLQPGIGLQVRDAEQVLESPVLTDATQPYLYAQVIGAVEEQFQVTVQLPNGGAIALPPFAWAE